MRELCAAGVESSSAEGVIYASGTPRTTLPHEESSVAQATTRDALTTGYLLLTKLDSYQANH